MEGSYSWNGIIIIFCLEYFSTAYHRYLLTNFLTQAELIKYHKVALIRIHSFVIRNVPRPVSILPEHWKLVD